MLGIFDSGLGGISVYLAVRKSFPRADVLYFGDTARVPYGSRSVETIRRYAGECARELVTRGATTLVIACNTVSAVAADVFRETGMPVVEIIGPTVGAVREGGWKKVAVIGTSATVNSHVYARALQDIGVMAPAEIACPLFTALVEEGMETHQATHLIAADYLGKLRGSGLEALILGCTHYPFLEHVIKETVGSGVKLIESGPAVAKTMKEKILRQELPASAFEGSGSLKLLFTDAREKTVETARKWLRANAEVEKVTVK